MSDSATFPQGLSLQSEEQHKGASPFLRHCPSVLEMYLLLKYLSERENEILTSALLKNLVSVGFDFQAVT